MKLHLPCRLRRAVVRALFAAATVVTTLASSTYADMITPDGRTATQVIQSGNVYDVYTNTVRGNTGFNSFSTFDVYADTTANLHLADGTGKLINVVRDSSSHIDGVLNSYKDGSIGGDVYFLNPHGIIVGKSGVINAGSISMSTPTAAFVEQLIARDGSISPTAMQAVLAGDMPISEKGTISIKGKVNSLRTAEIRAGRAEVKGGEINARVKVSEMVNTGGRKVDTQGMSIQDGKLSFGATPAVEGKAAQPAVEPEVVPEEESTAGLADISIFADNVLVDGGFLNADSVYIDPDVVNLVNTAISGEYTAEARIITIDHVSVKEGEELTSFTLYGDNEREAGNVSITISNSNITADEMNIYATATSDGAEAIVSITGCTLGSTYDPTEENATEENTALIIAATSESGNSRVDIQRSTITAGGGMDAAAMSVQGNASLTLDAASTVTADVAMLAAAASTGDADVSVHGKVTGSSAVTIAATTGYDGSGYTEEQDISKMELTPEGGGNATVTVDGTVEAEGSISVGAYAMGTYGDVTVDISGSLSAMATETRQVGELGLDRTEAETVNETDSEEQVNAKNAAYMKRYAEYLKALPTAEGATGTIAVEAASASGNASVSVTQPDFSHRLESSLSVSISADAAKAASVTLASEISSGNISATAKGETSTLSVPLEGFLESRPHQRFVQDGTVVSVEKANGSISLEAGTHDDDNPDAPAPAKRDGVLLEVAGVLAAMRGELDEEGEGGSISLVSSGKLTIDEGALLYATSDTGKGGTIYLDAPEYEILAGTDAFVVDGTTESGGILLMSYEEVTGDNINNLDDMSAAFLNGTFNPTYSGNGGGLRLLTANGDLPNDFKKWNVGYHHVHLEGHIRLYQDIDASLSTTAIADDTIIDGQGRFSLTLHNNFSHQFNLGASITIGKNVRITGMKNFTLDWNYESYMEAILNSYFASPTQLTVGENFTIDNTGNVSITLAGMYNTAISFGKGVNIQATGDVTISAMTRNGMGTNLLTSANTRLIPDIIKLIPGKQENAAAQAVSSAAGGLIRFNTDKIFSKLIARWVGKDAGKGVANLLSSIQVGVRSSHASITFADNGEKNAGKIKGNTVTISAKSTATVTGRKVAKKNLAGLSVGVVVNDCKVDLGDYLTITATGSKKDKNDDKRDWSVSITSTTKSKVNLQYLYSPEDQEVALGALVSLAFDKNTLNIKKNVKIEAKNDIDICTTSTIEAQPFMSLGKSQEREFEQNDVREYVEPEVGQRDPMEVQAAQTSVLAMIGVNYLEHTSDTKIEGTLTSSSGNINMKSEDEINSSLTMNGSVRNTLELSKPTNPKIDEDKKEWRTFVLDLLKESVNVDFWGFGSLGNDGNSWKMDTFTDITSYSKKFGEAAYAYSDLTNLRDKSGEATACVDVAVATDIVCSKNTLTFNGTAEAKAGSVTVEADSSIEAACGAETSIVGIPAKAAVAGSISVPVVTASTKAQIGSDATITAGKDIIVKATTDLPMSLDPVGWQDWKKFAKESVPAKKANDFFKALRTSLTYFSDYYDNGDLGALDGLTSSHASTFIRKTGGGDESAAVGGDFVIDVRNIDTAAIVQDNATLTAGEKGKISVRSLTTGKQATVAGRLPAFISPVYSVFMSSKHASSGFGFSTIVGRKAVNTVSYIGAAKLKTGQLDVDATGDVFMLELSVAGTAKAADNALQGGLNLIWEKRMTVSKISDGASITLTGMKEKGKEADTASSITAHDESTLLNLSGTLAGSEGTLAFGFGIAVTINNAFTSAMLGNNVGIDNAFTDAWQSVIDEKTGRFTGSQDITLTFIGDRNLVVWAKDTSFILSVGIAGAFQSGGGKEGVGVAANIGVLSNKSITSAKQYGVKAISISGGNDIATKATGKATFVSVAGDAAINISGQKDKVLGAGAASGIAGTMDTTADVTDFATHVAVIDPNTGKQKIDEQNKPVFTDSTLGEFIVDSSNTATAVAVDVAAAVGAADFGVAAGVSVIQLSGETGSYLNRGNVSAGKVGVTSLTDLTSCSVTLGAAVDVSIKVNGQNANVNGHEVQQDQFEEGMIEMQNINVEQQANQLVQEQNEIAGQGGGDNNNGNAGGEGNNNENIIENNIENDSHSLFGVPAMASDVSFALGASIAYNRMDMKSAAIVEGCSITSSGALKVTAEDKSVITAVSVGAAVAHSDGTSIAAGGVFSFAPVNSITEAVIRQKTDVKDKLKIKAGSLTLTATDNHRERLWSIGGGYGDSAGLGVVVSWGSYAGASTMTLMENVDAEIQKTADIEASSLLDSFYLSIGGSGSKGVLSLTGMVNYMNFNNHVVTDIKGSTLTIMDTEAGSITAKAYGKRKFTDGVGAVDIRISGGDKIGAGIGAALSFVYVGGNGADDTNTTQLLVSGSEILNAGTTKLLAESYTDGLMAVANAGVSVSPGAVGIAANGSVGLVNDASLTQVDIKDTLINAYAPNDVHGGAVLDTSSGDVTVEAKSDCQLTLGMGTLGVQIGKGAGIGASVGLLKDNAATMATMTASRVYGAGNFTLHAKGNTDLTGIVLGGGGSGTIGIAGGAMAGTIAHTVVAKLAESVMDVQGPLTIQAENTSNVGRDKGPRFTVVNGALGLFGGGAGLDVSIIDVADVVQANAHNVSVVAGQMKVLANEHSYADAIAVSAAGGQYAGVEVNVVRPVLRGAAEASITSDKQKLDSGDDVGITTVMNSFTNGSGKSTVSTGDLSVEATNNQWLRSHLWTLTLVVNPTLEPAGPSVAAAICVNTINMAGSSDARIQGPLTLNVAGKLDITADTDRYATYTTVPVSVAVAIFSAALNVDVNCMRVSNDTSPLTEKQDAIRNQGINAIDEEIKQLATLINKANVAVDKDAQLTINSDVGNAMKDAVNAVSKIEKPKTSAVLDLGSKSGVEGGAAYASAGPATVGGSVTIRAKDKVVSTPTTVNVTGGLLAIAPHIILSTVDSTVETIVQDTQLTAKGDISIKAIQEHDDNFDNVGVAIGAGSVSVAVYQWNDHSNEKIYLRGLTSLTSTGGGVSIATDSHIHEDFTHVEVAGGLLGAIACYCPSFEQIEVNELKIDSNVNIKAAAAANISTNSDCKLTARTVDVTLGLGVLEGGNTGVKLTTTQKLTTGDGVTIEGGTVAIRQDAERYIDWVTNHAVGALASLVFPYMSINDTVEATMTIGNGNLFTAKNVIVSSSSDIASGVTIESIVNAKAYIKFYGMNAGLGNFGAAWNSFKEKITNNTELGDNVKLRATDSTVRAKSTHTGDLSSNNIAANLVGDDILNTHNDADITSTVAIGTGFEATGLLDADGKPTIGNSLTLEAVNTDKFICRAEKVTASILAAPYSRNAFNTNGNSTATVTLAGGNIDVEDFTAKATTDVSVLVQQLLGGFSIIENTNTGKASNTLEQTSEVTLGTIDKKTKEANKLEITADNVTINAHNKYLFDRLDKTGNTMVAGKALGLVISITDAHVDATQTEKATVTLGSGAEIKRRLDAAHYLNRNQYKTLISATNNVESETSLDLLGGGLFTYMALVTKDDTTANATLNLDGSIDTWGDTELTAYSHVRHIMRNTAEPGGIPMGTDDLSYPVNKIKATDKVNINKSVESIGNITIQSGSTQGEYKLLDGAVVLSGDDDTNSTNFNYGKHHAIISNERREIVNIGGNAAVRAGGELAIYNDSSANTSKKKLEQHRTADDYINAAIDTGADVTSTVSIVEGAKLYAGLGSAVMMKFQKGGSDNEAALQLTTAQQLFAEQKQVGDLWQMNVSATPDAPAGSANLLFDVIAPAQAGGKYTLSIRELTLPGMAFRIVTNGNKDTFKGMLFSPAKHGLDIFIAADWAGDVVTNGVTLQGHETGLIFNRTPLDSGKFTIASCAGPDLYLAEGVSVRSQAQGNLAMSGAYRFPYSTFLATSDHDLTITGQISCGNTVFEAGGTFTVKTDSDYSLRSALSMYEKLFEDWEKRIPGLVNEHAQKEVVEKSGAKEAHDTEGVYKAKDQENTYGPQTIRDQVAKAIGDKEAIVDAMGTVTITANVVDLNGKICSGLLNSEIVINDGFKVLTNDGRPITVAEAQKISNGGTGPQSVFKLDGYTGLSLVYDAREDQIFLNSFETLQAGISITGNNIVNSDPTGSSGLYVAGPSRSLDVTNNSRYTLNVGNVDLTKNTATLGITLNNKGTGKVTQYLLNDKGQWVKTVGGGAPTAVGSTDSYTGLSDMQVKLEKGLKIGITENGRLTHGGSLGDVEKNYKDYKFHDNGTAGLVGAKGNEKQTIIDAITVNTQNPLTTKELTASYVAYNATHKNGCARTTNELTEKKLTTLYDAGTAYRWHYALDYDELITAELYVGAANPVAVNLGSAGTGGLSIVSKNGNINFTGKVDALSCSVSAAGSITATAGALITGNSINMAAQGGSIGSSINGTLADGNKAALAFNAGTASFTAAQDIYAVQNNEAAIAKMTLNAGQTVDVRTGGAINDLQMTALDSITVAAQGDITVTGGRVGRAASLYPARVSLSSQKGGVSVKGGDFTHGIFTVAAQGNVSIKSTPAGNITLDYVESREGNVSIEANGDILTVRGADLSNLTLGDSGSTSLGGQTNSVLASLTEGFYEKMLEYERLYYEKDGDGKYTHRSADGTFILPEGEATLASLGKTLTELYEAGRGDELGDIMMAISGTTAVGGTRFKDKAAALSYLAEHSDKLGTDFVPAYYDRLVAAVTDEIIAIHGPEKDIDYGAFSESIYRLFWLRDCNGKLVNQDDFGHFVSPLMEGSGEPVYSPEMCEAITAQFREQPAFGGQSVYHAGDSALLKQLANSASGQQAAVYDIGKMEGGIGALLGGQPIGDIMLTISANKGTVSLSANNGLGNIGGGAFHFTIKPVKTENGAHTYSSWAQAFINSATTEIWPGIGDVTLNETTGEYQVSLAFIDVSKSGVNSLNAALLEHALPDDVMTFSDHGLYRVNLRNYIGVDAQGIKAEGKDIRLAANQKVTLGDGGIQAQNLFLSSADTITGSIGNTGEGCRVSLFADNGIGSADDFFEIGGGAAFTLGSSADIYVKPTTEVKVSSITGKRVTVDSNYGSMLPTAQASALPNITGQRIDFYGNLDTGLGFRTTGTSMANGGLHWYGGNSDTLKFNALNTAYTLWFVREGDAPNLNKADIGYSGHLYIVNLAGVMERPLLRANAKSGGVPALAVPPAMGGGSGAITANFHQINAKGGRNLLEFEGDQTFGSLSLDGEGAYTVMSSGELLLGSSLSVGGNATLNFAGLGSTQGDAVGINSTGDLALASCKVKNDLVVNSTGNVTLEDVHLLGGEASIAGDTVSLNGTSGSEMLVLNGSNGVTGKDVASTQIIANSSNAGVFLNSTSTNSLSGSSHSSFVASVQPLDGSTGVTVKDVSANGTTSKVIIQAITDQLVLDGYISGAALEFYSTGIIDEETGAMLLSLYPFWDVWQSEDPEVWSLAIETLESDLLEGYIWLVEEVEAMPDKSCDSVQETRRRVNAEEQRHRTAPLRFTDGKGNTVTREQFANLITSK